MEYQRDFCPCFEYNLGLFSFVLALKSKSLLPSFGIEGSSNSIPVNGNFSETFWSSTEQRPWIGKADEDIGILMYIVANPSITIFAYLQSKGKFTQFFTNHAFILVFELLRPKNYLSILKPLCILWTNNSAQKPVVVNTNVSRIQRIQKTQLEGPSSISEHDIHKGLWGVVPGTCIFNSPEFKNPDNFVILIVHESSSGLQQSIYNIFIKTYRNKKLGGQRNKYWIRWSLDKEEIKKVGRSTYSLHFLHDLTFEMFKTGCLVSTGRWVNYKKIHVVLYYWVAHRIEKIHGKHKTCVLKQRNVAMWSYSRHIFSTPPCPVLFRI